MVRRTYTQRSLIEVLLPDADKLWDPALKQIDVLLEDEVLLDRVAEALARRHPASTRRGRLGTPAAVVLRMLVLKHQYDWSFDECEREVRGSLVYRAFCRIDGERVPDAKTLIRLAHLLDGPVLKQVLERLVEIGRERRVVRGRRLRVDTTVVETTIQYPTDSGLLADGVRVLTRTMQRLRERVAPATPPIRNRARSVGRRVFEIGQRTRSATLRAGAATREKSKARMAVLYREVMAITRTVVRQADTLAARVPAQATRMVQQLAQRLRGTTELVRRVLAQTRARIVEGNTHYPDKVLSLFEPHTEAIRKGKAAKPTEFGKLVKIQEAEAQFITDYEVCPTRVPDGALWMPSVERHIEALRAATAARGGRCGVRVAGQRARGAGARRPPGRPPAAARGKVSTTDSGGGPVANRLRGSHQCTETSARARAVSLSRSGRHRALGGPGSHRQ